jgi:hypothetical protein
MAKESTTDQERITQPNEDQMTTRAPVTVAGIIEALESQRVAIVEDATMTLEQRVKLHNSVIDRQLRAAMLDLQYRRSAARLPESGLGLTAMLTGSKINAKGEAGAH